MNQISIIGAGLIGSSIARNVSHHYPKCKIQIIDNSKSVLKICKKIKLGNFFKHKIDSDINKSQFIFICTPISSYKTIFSSLQKFDLKNSLITDVGSSKTKVIELAKKYFKGKFFVPGHPVAGTEYSGPRSGFKELFKNRWCILTPCSLCNKKKILSISKIWKKFGSKITIMNARHHDSIMAITSHIPHLIAYNIVGTAFDLGKKLKSEVIQFSASGFRDFTRIASSDPTMWRDIMLTNKKEILSMLTKFNKDLNRLKTAIQNDDGKYLFNKFKKTREIRNNIIKAGQDINLPNFGRKN